jgi:adenylate cyclase
MALIETEGFKRRLAAIVATDLVGYSQLMGRDEAGTLARLKDYRKTIIDPKIIVRGGRIVKLTGDGMLLEFPSITDAVMCAVEIKEAVALRVPPIPLTPAFVFELGSILGM